MFVRLNHPFIAPTNSCASSLLTYVYVNSRDAIAGEPTANRLQQKPVDKNPRTRLLGLSGVRRPRGRNSPNKFYTNKIEKREKEKPFQLELLICPPIGTCRVVTTFFFLLPVNTFVFQSERLRTGVY